MHKRTAHIGVFAALLVIFVIEVSSQDVAIKPSDRRLLVALGSKRVLDCYVTSSESLSPSSILNWEGPNNATFTVNTQTDNKVTYHNILTIDYFTSNDVGTYTCQFTVTGDLTSIELFAVKENKIEGEFFYGNKSALLQCTLEFPDGSTSATFVTWLLENSSLSQLKNPDRFTDFNNGTLLITYPTRGDAGPYVARYRVTDTISSDTYDCNVIYKAAPLVLSMAKSKNVFEGDTLHLECLVKGYPRADVTWLRENITVVKDGGHVNMVALHGYENAKLVISSANSTDGGNYTCVATQSGEWSSKSIFVRVKDPLQWLWPVLGIFGELVALAIIIFTCSKLKKDDHTAKPADEREGLLRQGSGRNREHEKHT